MSIASMKLNAHLATGKDVLLDVELEVVAINDAPDSREVSVHLRRPGAPSKGTVDLVLLGDDRDEVLTVIGNALKVGAKVKLSAVFLPTESV